MTNLVAKVNSLDNFSAKYPKSIFFSLYMRSKANSPEINENPFSRKTLNEYTSSTLSLRSIGKVETAEVPIPKAVCRVISNF